LVDLKTVTDTKEQIEVPHDKLITEEIKKEVPMPATLRQPEEDGLVKISQPGKLDLLKLEETKDKIAKPLEPTFSIEVKGPVAKPKPVVLKPAKEKKAEIAQPKPAEEDGIPKVEEKKQEVSISEAKEKLIKPLKPVAIGVEKPRVVVPKRISMRSDEEAKVKQIEQKKEDVSISKTKDKICKIHKQVVNDAAKPHVHEPDVIHSPSSLDKSLKVVGTDRCISCKQNKISPCFHIYRNIRYFETKSFWEKRQQNK